MGATSFNTIGVAIVQPLGLDGATPAATDNPLPTALQTSTASIGSVTLGTGTAPIGSLVAGTAAIGKVNLNPGAAALTSASINFSNAGTATVVASSTGTVIRIFKLFMVNSTATNLLFQDGTTNLTGAVNFGANGSLMLDLDGEPWFTGTAGNAFNMNISATSQISGRIYYTQA